jgi:hypothetical protein
MHWATDRSCGREPHHLCCFALLRWTVTAAAPLLDGLWRSVSNGISTLAQAHDQVNGRQEEEGRLAADLGACNSTGIVAALRRLNNMELRHWKRWRLTSLGVLG